MKKGSETTPEKEGSSLQLAIGLGGLALIAVPFLYYSVIINDYGTKNQPEGFEFPKLSDFWRTLVVAVGT